MPWKFSIATLLMAPVIILSFQNCTDFAIQDQIMYEQALLESRDALDAELTPALINSNTLRRWYKTSDANYMNQSLSGNQWSMIVAVPRAATGKIAYLNSGADTEEGSITVSAGKIQASRYNNVGTAYSEVLEADLPTSGDSMVIAASFGAEKGQISLLVNGKVQQTAVVSTGAPEDFTAGSKAWNTSGTFGEYLVFVGNSSTSAGNGKLSIAELNVMSRYVANGLSIPNVIFDPVVVGGSSGGGDGDIDNSRFLAAKAILDNKCVGCHSGGQAPNLSNYTEAKALASGYVVNGSPTSSQLYTQLKGSAGGGAKDMPQGTSISASEVQAIADWISNIP